MSNQIITGDALEILRTLPSESVQCCVTSPPYYGLRDYGTAQWTGGDPECDHFKVLLASENSTLRNDGRKHTGPYEGEKKRSTGIPYKDTCGKCGAQRIDQQIGLEETPEAYVEKLVTVFREVRRVLRDDGTLWVNLGDSYMGSGPNRQENVGNLGERVSVGKDTRGLRVLGLKPKDLIGIPWMVAFALRSDGWYLRSDCIWSKPNAMPESVTDRPTKSHEYLFLLSKSERYFYDADAIREPLIYPDRIYAPSDNHKTLELTKQGNRTTGGLHDGRTTYTNSLGRNKRTVWTIASQPYSEAHFATFPPKLIEPCILAGSRPGDVVLDCFMGAGTVALVALQHHRNYLGIELNPVYVALAEKRIDTVQQNLWSGSEVVA